jgi:hypothetical protein
MPIMKVSSKRIKILSFKKIIQENINIFLILKAIDKRNQNIIGSILEEAPP